MKKYFSNKQWQINIIIAVVFFSFISIASSGGMTGVTLLSGNPGCTCHGPSPNQGVQVVISGPTELTPNERGSYTVTISGGPLVRAGVNIASSAGDLAGSPSDGIQKIGTQLTHTQPKLPSSGTVTFPFMLTAPANVGTSITLAANGNSVNFNGSESGDQWNFAQNLTINVVTSLEDEENIINSFALQQNYPNPFNPSTLINYQLASNGFISLKVYDITGKEIAELVNEEMSAGKHQIEFNSSQFNITSGVYLYQLRTNDFVETKKMILTK